VERGMTDARTWDAQWAIQAQHRPRCCFVWSESSVGVTEARRGSLHPGCQTERGSEEEVNEAEIGGECGRSLF
jgi:hypothetical protein